MSLILSIIVTTIMTTITIHCVDRFQWLILSYIIFTCIYYEVLMMFFLIVQYTVQLFCSMSRSCCCRASRARTARNHQKHGVTAEATESATLILWRRWHDADAEKKNIHWLVVTGTWLDYELPEILGMSSSQLTFSPSFFRGVAQPPTR